MLRIAALLLGLAGAGAAVAQPYPARPVQLIVPISPGTGTDVTARYVADQLTKAFNSAFVVDNKVGANGIIGTDYVAKAAPDGYTMLMTASTHYINKFLYPKMPYDPVADFTAVAGINTTYLVLVTARSSGIKSVGDLQAAMRARPRQIEYASAGSGSTTHLAGTLFVAMSGVEALHIPYKGGAQALTDTAGGQVTFTFTGIASAIPHIKSGRLVALATTGLKRPASLPDVSTVAESGLAGYDIASRIGLTAPKGTPREAIRRVSDTLEKIVQSKAFIDFCLAQGLDAGYAATEAYAAEGPAELQHWAKIVATSGAKAD